MQHQLHMIGNAHLDPVWLWRWPEGLQALRATFRSALDRMNETPGFIFTSSQAATYEWIERTEPKMFQEIQERVAQGRWVIVGGWWVQPDCNIPSGEGFVRQSLYGQRYFYEKFGLIATVGYNVDSFGHNGMLPQILKKSGMGYYVFMRPNPRENPDLPGRLFHWESPDGSRVLTYQIPYAYNSVRGVKLREKIEQTATELTDGVPLLMCFFGVGNHGGGPTKENIQVILEEGQKEGPEVIFSDPVQYFAEVEQRDLDLPVVRDDLQHHASGCYAAHSEIKRNNRLSEHRLATAEKIAVTANVLTGFAYPRTPIEDAWRGVLFNHFHDILAGTSIKEAYDDARDLHGRALQTASEVKNFALQALAAQIDLTGDGMPIVVWNPHAGRQKSPVEIEFQWEAHWQGRDVALVDVYGREVPVQKTSLSAVVNEGTRLSLLFEADVPSFGYTVYWVKSRPPAITSSHVGRLGVMLRDDLSAPTLFNDQLEISFDRSTGAIQSIKRLNDGWEVLQSPSGAIVLDDPSDTWSHDVYRFDREIGRFDHAKFEVVEQGPVRATLRVTATYHQSTLVQEYSLYAGASHVDVRVMVDWRDRLKALKLEFPANVSDPRATYEIPFGVIERPADGEEEPGLHWVDVTGRALMAAEEGAHNGSDIKAAIGAVRGLALVNDAKYSYDVSENKLRLTVLRSPVYAHHVPKELQPDGHYYVTDQGWQEFRYQLIPHDGDFTGSMAPTLGQKLNVRPLAVVESNHPGELPREFSLLSVDQSNVLLSAVKQSEEGDGVIVRAYEAYGRSCTVQFCWQEQYVWQAQFGPYEVKTFHLSGFGKGTSVKETDFLEGLVEKAGVGKDRGPRL